MTRKRCRILRDLSFDGNEKADEFAKESAMWDEGVMAQARAKTVHQERRSVRSCVVCSQLSLFNEGMERLRSIYAAAERKIGSSWIRKEKKREEPKHQTEWCAFISRYGRMRCERSSKCMKMQGTCTGPNFLPQIVGRLGKRHMGGHDLVRRMDRQGEVLNWCRKCSGHARRRMGL